MIISKIFLCNGNFRIEIDILNKIEHLDSFSERALKGFSAGDQSHASCTLIDDRGADCLTKIAFSRSSPRIDETAASHIAIDHLVAAKIDRMIRRKLRINLIIG